MLEMDRRHRPFDRRIAAWVLAGAIFATAIFAPTAATAQAAGRGVISVSGSDGLEGFQAQVDGRELPRNFASARDYFGRPASRRHVGLKRDPECQLRWPSRHVTANFYHGYGGVRSSCAPAAGTLVVEFGAGWTTDTGLRVGASVAELRAAYPGATRHGPKTYPATTRHGSIWGLVESYPPWGGTIDVLAAHVLRGRVVALATAGPEAWDE
jgi:hypothetical protein